MVKNKIFSSLCIGLILVVVCACSRQQSDWQKTRETNTTDAYELFLKKYPSGEFTAQAEARVKELYEERDWQKARDTDTPEAYQAFVKQYPEGKWTEEARIRVENFTLAQTPGVNPLPANGAATANSAPADTSAPTSLATTASPSTPTPAVTPSKTAGAKPAKPPGVAPAAPPARSARSAKTARSAASSATANGSGHFGIQLGAFKTDRGAADQRWARLQKEYPKVLAGLSSTVLPKQAATGNWYRLQAIGLTEKHARSICGSLKAQSEACLVVRPTTG